MENSKMEIMIKLYDNEISAKIPAESTATDVIETLVPMLGAVGFQKSSVIKGMTQYLAEQELYDQMITKETEED